MLQPSRLSLIPITFREGEEAASNTSERDTVSELRRRMAEMMSRMRRLEAQIDSEREGLSVEPPPGYAELHVNNQN